MWPASAKTHRAANATLPVATLIALPLLLLLLAILQYRWTGKLSEGERERTRAGLRRALQELALDFDRELARLYLSMQPEPAGESDEFLARRYVDWRSTAEEPALLRGVFLTTQHPSRNGQSGANSGMGGQVWSFDPKQEKLIKTEWPTEIRQAIHRLLPWGPAARRSHRRGFGWNRGEAQGMARGARLFAAGLPALLIPIAPPAGRGHGRERFGPRGSIRLLVLWLDLSVIREQIMPKLVQRHLRGFPYNLYLSTNASANRSSESSAENLIFNHGPSILATAPESADAEVRLFGPLPPEAMRRLLTETGIASPFGEAIGPGYPARFRTRGGPMAPASQQGGWRLQAVHPQGSLDAVVAAARRRNLSISMGILALLAGAAALLVQAARRTQRLARQQMEFVAGVTHEILTPLAAIRSAGQNLADGVVAEEAQVRRYGSLIDGEGRRLSNMVSQVLEFAGMQARGHSLQLAPLSLAEVIHAAVEDSSASLEEAGIEVELDLEENLPAVLADANALRRTLMNLISNAVKYAAAGAWLGISLSQGDGAKLRLIIEDRGPGIDNRDLPHIFEPFFRGRKVSASTITGSGLGLSLVRGTVREHGGSIEVETTDQAGCRFVIHLPLMAEKKQAGDKE